MTDCWCRHKTVCSTAHSPPSSLLQILHSTSYAIWPQGCTHRDCSQHTTTTTTTDTTRDEEAAKLESDSIMEGSVCWLELLRKSTCSNGRIRFDHSGKVSSLPSTSLTHTTPNHEEQDQVSRGSKKQYPPTPLPMENQNRFASIKDSRSNSACLYWYRSK